MATRTRPPPVEPGKCLNLLDKLFAVLSLTPNLPPLHSVIGSSDLFHEPQAKRIKMGMINVTANNVCQALKVVLDYPLFPLSLEGKNGSLLKEALFSGRIGFTSVQGIV